GYKVYILSNYSDLGYNRSKPDFTFLPYTDGALISYEVKLVKPDPAIYAALCERFSIIPENAVFLDDRPENTEAARAFGMHAITVESKAQADSALHALGVQY
ncbi:MAG: HAD-IA family hydrolase, partial [Hominenteromicrobium sp.]